jgi:hypothetical protein
MALGRVERLQIMLTADELAAVDDWPLRPTNAESCGCYSRIA